jgi:hypothetical protein
MTSISLRATKRATSLTTERRALIRNLIIQNEANMVSLWQTNVSSLTFTHVNVGSDQLIIVGTAVEDATASNRDITGITWEGQAMTKIREDINGNKETQLWYKEGDAGNDDITIIVSFSGTVAKAMAGSLGFENVDQANPISANAGGSGTSTTPNVDITTVKKNDIGTDIAFGESTDEFDADYSLIGQNRDRNREGEGVAAATSHTEPKAAGTTLNMAWIRDNSNPWVMSVCTISASFAQNLIARARDTSLIAEGKA